LPVPLPIWIEEFDPVAISDLIQNIVMIIIFWGQAQPAAGLPLDGGHFTRDVLGRINPRDGIRSRSCCRSWWPRPWLWWG
jgi:hypothetical protein